MIHMNATRLSGLGLINKNNCKMQRRQVLRHKYSDSEKKSTKKPGKGETALDLTVGKLPTLNATVSKQSKYADQFIFPNADGPSRCIFNGPSKSGKTNYALTLLCDPKFMKGFFDTIYVYCPSYGLQTDYDHLKACYPESDLFIKDFDADVVQQDWDQAKRVIEVCKKNKWAYPQTLMLFDDLINTPGFDKCAATLCTKARHSCISVWVISQGLMSLSRLMRLQASNVFAFSPTESEIDRLAAECTNAIASEDQVHQMIRQATKKRFEPFHFYREAPATLQYRQGLTNFFQLHDPAEH